MTINLANALTALNSAGIDIDADFHALPSSQVEVLVELAKADGYKKPANANGSTARYYFAALQRKNYAGQKGDSQ